MSSTPDIAKSLTVIVPAAGIGLRFGAKDAKQYTKIGQQTILAYTLDVLLSHAHIGEVLLVLHPDDQQQQDWPNIKTTIGGDTRAQSVLNGLNALKLCDDDWVLVHDACRPCLSHQDIDRLIIAVADDAVGGVLAVPMSDTVKYVKHGRIQKTIDRTELWRAQTPQMFRYGLLREGLRQALAQDYPVTDEASAVEFLGKQPLVVPGSATNIKITYPHDVKMAQYYLEHDLCE